MMNSYSRRELNASRANYNLPGVAVDKALDNAVAGETIGIDETGFGPFQVKVKAGSSTFTVDEPLGDGGGGLGSGPNPYDLLSAAVGACALMTIRLYAKRKQWPLDQVRVKVTHFRDTLNAKDRFIRELEFSGPLDESQKARLVEIALRCPVSLTVERGSTITTTLLDTGAMQSEAITRCNHIRDMDQACADLGDDQSNLASPVVPRA
jgi:putative redox protein